MAANAEEASRLSVTLSKLEIQKEEEEHERSQLTDHLIYSVMLLLPLETLLRFCSVSKYWRDTIRSRSFNMNRRELVPSVENIVYCFAGPERGKMQSTAAIYRICGNEFQSLKPLSVEVSFLKNGCEPLNLEVPFLKNGRKDNEDGVSFVSALSCDGLVCVIHNSGRGGSFNQIIIWNPYAHQSKSFSWPGAFKNDSYNESFFVGFGYDTTISDYKIVVIKSPVTHSSKWQVQITPLKQRNSWREVEISDSLLPLPHNLVHKRHGFRPVTVQEDIYWVGKVRNDNSRHILKFSLTNETLTTLSLPSEVGGNLSTQTINLKLTEYGNSGRQMRVQMGHRNNKSLYLYNYNAYPDYPRGTAAVEAWLYSKEEPREPFTKVLSISETAISQNDSAGLIRPLGYIANGHFIMTLCNSHRLAAYNPQQDTLETLEPAEDRIWPNGTYACGVAFVDMETAFLP